MSRFQRSDVSSFVSVPETAKQDVSYLASVAAGFIIPMAAQLPSNAAGFGHVNL
jgi:hypothetical protein